MAKLIKKLKASLLGLKGPMAQGEKFITLSEEYLNQFDEIVVVGDIHGCYDEFKELLAKVHSESPTRNPNKCLKILVGDLVNKGPKSGKVLELCRDIYPESIIAVRGNHDEVVLREHAKFKESGSKALSAKNKWIEKLPSRYIAYLKLLPYSITVPSLNCIIVHAGLKPSIDEPNKNTPTDVMVSMRNIVVEKDPKTEETYYRCTSAENEGASWATFWPGPEHVYFGHDARRRLQDHHEFATGLDTGCVYGDKLSYTYIKGSKKGQIFSIKARKVYEPVKDNDNVDSAAEEDNSKENDKKQQKNGRKKAGKSSSRWGYSSSSQGYSSSTRGDNSSWLPAFSSWGGGGGGDCSTVSGGGGGGSYDCGTVSGGGGGGGDCGTTSGGCCDSGGGGY